MFLTVCVEGKGGRYIHVSHPRELCVYFAVSAECAMRAHVLVLAWDGRSFLGQVTQNR